MIDESVFHDVIVKYKNFLKTEDWGSQELYKWEAVSVFQKNWDIDAANLSDMLKTSLSATKNLLVSQSSYPRGMIQIMAEWAPEEIRSMFKALYDESQDVCERIENFKQSAVTVFQRYNHGENNHYQDEHAISVYLWLRYPDKYYIYQFGIIKNVAERLNTGLVFKKGAYKQNMAQFYPLYDELNGLIKSDTELATLLGKHISGNNRYYSDLELKTLTVDIGHYIGRYLEKKDFVKVESIQNENPSVDQSHDDIQEVSDDNPIVKQKNFETYDDDAFLKEVYMNKEDLSTLKKLLTAKKNIILQGAPGTGKTFAATRLAYAMMEQKDESRVEIVQFHQNYSYEDFIMGYKPEKDGGFILQKGVFYKFCRMARSAPEKPFFFIIDEINRGNLSKIFGELLMLIENSYRNDKHAVKLAYSDEKFYVPDNLYIIGMMNTADRSLAMIDYALRRRFAFFKMKPGFDTAGFMTYQKEIGNAKFDKVIEAVKSLNATILKDDSLGEGFCIGHSYFCNQESFDYDWLRNVVLYDIAPMLEEYWFDNKETRNNEIDKLIKVLND